MKPNLKDRLTHAWNVFSLGGSPPTNDVVVSFGSSHSRKTNRYTMASSFSAAIYNRIALDVAMTTFQHIKEDKHTEDVEIMESGLNNCLTVEANIDQSHIAFIQDIVFSMFDEGAVAVTPVDTSINPNISGSYDIDTMRTARILDYRTKHVLINVYNEDIGRNVDIWVPKAHTAIIENPLYAVVNAPNSSLQRLLRKMNLIDNFDEMVSAGKLDIILQIPYAVRTDQQKSLVDERLKLIEEQLKTSQHGIAYIDSAERITQLNRAANNQLLESVKLLSEQFYNQIGLTPKVFNGTATEAEMRNYYNRSIDPIVETIISEFTRKFITKTGRTQGQKVVGFRNNFKLVPVEQIINLGDTFRRNQIATSNEIRKLVGFKVSNDPLADELANPNLKSEDRGAGQSNSLLKFEEPEEDELLEEEEENMP